MFIKYFLYFLVFYQPISTILSYWLGLQIRPWYIALSKDIIWLCFFLLIIFSNLSSFFLYIKKTYIILLFFLLFLISGFFSIYLYNWFDFFELKKYVIINIWSVFQWFRTILYPLIIFWSSIFVWIILYPKYWNFLDKKFFLFFFYIILLWWSFFQSAKHLFPSFFYHIWYGQVWDRKPWQNPPIYYRTWPWWIPRFSWLFAWPNNFWYLIILFSPLLYFFVLKKDEEKQLKVTNFNQKINKQNIKQNYDLTNNQQEDISRNQSDFIFKEKKHINIKKLSEIFIFIVLIISWILTMSRAVILAWCLQIIIIFYKKIQQNKKIFLPIFFLFLFLFLILSIYKIGSTSLHLSLRKDWLHYFFENPLYWYGIWYSWPSAHYTDSIIPENFYLQILIDSWIIGFIFWICSIIGILIFLKKNISDKIFNLNNQLGFIILWLFSLFVIWMFLHIWEDNTINYIFFVIFWIMIGSKINTNNFSKKSF